MHLFYVNGQSVGNPCNCSWFGMERANQGIVSSLDKEKNPKPTNISLEINVPRNSVHRENKTSASYIVFSVA